jgi:divalent metal cation (Fe/Co/Zn/Cd) transporter
MPDIVQVNTHLESRGTGMGDGRDVTFQERTLVERVRQLTDEIAGAQSCHNVMVRRHGQRVSVSLHCHFEKTLSIIEVHELSTRIEEQLKEKIPGVERVLVHAEPEVVSPPKQK